MHLPLLDLKTLNLKQYIMITTPERLTKALRYVHLLFLYKNGMKTSYFVREKSCYVSFSNHNMNLIRYNLQEVRSLLIFTMKPKSSDQSIRATISFRVLVLLFCQYKSSFEIDLAWRTFCIVSK